MRRLARSIWAATNASWRAAARVGSWTVAIGVSWAADKLSRIFYPDLSTDSTELDEGRTAADGKKRRPAGSLRAMRGILHGEPTIGAMSESPIAVLVSGGLD